MMTTLLPLLMDPRRVTDGLTPGAVHPFAEPLLVVGILLLLALAVFVAIFVLHKPAGAGGRRHRHRHRHHHHHHPEPESADGVDSATVAEELASSSRHSRRRHHHSHTARNPSLAETGGLPPKRIEPAAPPANFPPQT